METAVAQRKTGPVWLTARIVCVGLSVLLLMLPATLSHADHADPPWWPIPVKSYYGTYNPVHKRLGQACTSLGRPKLEEWVPPRPAAKPYEVGVCIPHLKDPYWLAVNYGMITEARRLGIGIRLLEAGGYDELHTQIAQMRGLAASGVDGILLGAVSYSDSDAVIAEITAQGIPVVAVSNDVSAPSVSAKALVSFYEMGYFAGEFVVENAEKAALETVRISFFPGPRNSGWAPETLDGFMDAMEYFPGHVDVLDVSWGDTGKDVQRELLRKSVYRTGPVDYVVCNAVAAEAAPDLFREMGLTRDSRIVSTYLMPSLYDKIVSGQVAAAPSDLSVFQGRMGVDMMVRILNGDTPGREFPFRSGPFIPMVTPGNISSYPYEGLFGPKDYKPEFSFRPGQ